MLATLLLATALPRIVVSGNERTRDDYVEHIVANCIDDMASLGAESSGAAAPVLAAEPLRACIMNSRLFSDVTVELQPQLVSVKVEERWTLIPLPFAKVGTGSERAAGLFLLESNFLGRGQTLAAGATFSDAGTSIVGYLRDPSVAFTPVSLSALGLSSVLDVRAYDGKNDVEGFRERKMAGGVTVGYRWSDVLSTNLEIARATLDYQRLETFAPPPQPWDEVSLQGRTLVGKQRFRLYFQEGVLAQIDVRGQAMRRGEGTRATSAGLKVSGGVGMFGDHALKGLFSSGIVRGGGVADTWRLGAKDGFRGIPANGAWAERFYAGAIDYLVPVHAGENGTLATGVFTDAGALWLRGAKAREERYVAYGIGAYYFLKRVAIPGLGLEVGFNEAYQGVFGTVSLGLSI